MAVDGASCVVSVRKKLVVSVLIRVEGGIRDVSKMVLYKIVVAWGRVESNVISMRLVSVNASRVVVRSSVVKRVVTIGGSREVRVM